MRNYILEIKEKFGDEAEHIIASGLNIKSRGKKYQCPNKLAHKNGDRNPSMGWHKQAHQFHCLTCGMKIDIYGYYREHLNYSHDEIVLELLGEEKNKKFENDRDKFKKELEKVTDINDKCITYIEKRKINKKAIEHFNIKSYGDNVAFPYYKYTSIVGYKIRNLEKEKKMWSLNGSKPYLFNFQNLSEDKEEIIICEGEFDCMVLWQCGFNNVVSVGAGANSLSSLLTQCKEFLVQYENIIVVSDNDAAGEKMDEIFLKEFDTKAKLIDKNLYCENDINAEYYKYGEEKIKKIIESGRLKIEGRRDLDIEEYKGLCSKQGNYIPTGMPSIDYAINDLAPGRVTAIVGRTNAGKTTFTKQIISNAISLGNKVFCVSGEGEQETFINEIYKNVIGKNDEYYYTVKNNKRSHKEPKKEVLEALKQWHKGKLVMFSKGDSKLKTLQQLFDMISYEIKVKRHNLVVLDNMMSLLSVTNSDAKNDLQGEFVQNCCDIAKAYNTHIIIVVHPRKAQYGAIKLDIENISGSMDIGNKVDNIIAVIRKYKEENDEEINKLWSHGGEIKLLKNRYYPNLVSVKTSFQKDTGLILQINEKNNMLMEYDFNWQKYMNIKEGEQCEFDF